MGKTIILKLLFIGLATTIVRIIGQLSIPAGEQTVLAPSVFAQNGTMPLAFTVYGIFAYSLIASLFLLIRDRLSGNRILQGLKYGFSCCVVWIVYLLEPLPHVAVIDRITYPVADSLALIVMGLLLGWLFGNPAQRTDKAKLPFPILPVLIITACFFAGRMIQYLILGIYSSFDAKSLETVLWCMLTGIALSCVMAWLNRYVDSNGRIKRAFILGGLLFGVDLALFNFFMPLVFAADIPDLILRTFIDILAVTVGCLAFPNKHNVGELYGKTSAQVILRWNVQQGVIVIPKSVHKERMEENLAIWDFNLDHEEMEKITALDKGCPSMLDTRKISEVKRVYDYLNNPVLTSL